MYSPARMIDFMFVMVHSWNHAEMYLNPCLCCCSLGSFTCRQGRATQQWSPLLRPTTTWSILRAQPQLKLTSSTVKLHLRTLLAQRIAASVMLQYEKVKEKQRARELNVVFVLSQLKVGVCLLPHLVCSVFFSFS